jgi:hypothetical protein
MTASIDILFIGGVGRSGSTLLADMLGQLPKVENIGESQYIWERGIKANDLCGCGNPFRACDYWRTVGDRAFGGWDEVDVDGLLSLQAQVDRNRFIPQLAAPSLTPRFEAKVARYVETLRALYTGVREVTGAETIVDASKHVSYAYVLRLAKGVETRVVQSIRDSRGVAYSWAKKVRRAEVTAGDSYMPQFKPGTTAALWLAADALLHVLAPLGVPVIDVLYEKLIADPQQELERIAEFAGLGPVDLSFVGEDWVELGPSHTVSGNNSRFVTGHVPLKLDSSWRAEMNPEERDLVTVITWLGLKRHGYI